MRVLRVELASTGADMYLLTNAWGIAGPVGNSGRASGAFSLRG